MASEPESGSERRVHVRHAVERPCKLVDRRAPRFFAAHTVDVSAGGALVHVDLGRPLAVGDEVNVLLGWDSPALVSARSAAGARVVRIIEMKDGHQRAALAFDEPQAGLMCAA